VNPTTSPVTFTALNSVISAVQFQALAPHPTNNSLVLGGTQDNGTIRWTNSGNAWSEQDGGDGGVVLFDQKDPTFAYHTYAGMIPAIAVSTDAGLTWNSGTATNGIRNVFGSDSAHFYPALAVDPGTPHRVVLGGHKIYVSTDGMLTWAVQETTDLSDACGNQNCAIADIEFAPSAPSTAYATASNDGGSSSSAFTLFISNNANVNASGTWTSISSGLPTTATTISSIGVDPHNAANVYVAMEGFTAMTGAGHIYNSTNKGGTWTRADGNGGSSPLPDVPTSKVIVDSTDATGKTVLAGTDIGIFRSTDGGATWASFNLGTIPAVPIYDLQQNSNGVIFAGTHGRGAYMNLPGGATPTPTASPTPSPVSTATSTGGATPTPTSTGTTVATPTPTIGPTPTVGPTPIPGTKKPIKISPKPVNFKKVAVGHPSTLPVTLENVDKVSVTVENYSISETQTKKNTGLHFVATQECVQKTLAPKGTCVLHVTFTPTVAKVTSKATLNVMSNTVKDLAKGPLTGTGQ
jgi:hypothetical protein